MPTSALRRELVLASGNRGKLRELQSSLEPLGWLVSSQGDNAVPEVEETGHTFVENALIKARNASAFTNKPALADDSGLEVDALQGRPGIYSARFAGPLATDADNNEKLLAELSGIEPPHRTARFHCVLVWVRFALDPVPLICSAAWEGIILESPRGEQGFGYDPLFLPTGSDLTSAQMPSAIKNRQSHRGQAMASLVAALSAE
jgi:XTP/dITP diphosphohydrolase